MKRYIKPASILIKMDQLTLLAGSGSSDVGTQITGREGDKKNDIIDQNKEQVGNGNVFAKQNYLPFDDSDDNMDW